MALPQKEPVAYIAALAALALFASMLGVSLALWLVCPRMMAIEHVVGGRNGPVDLPWIFSEQGKGHRLDLTVSVHWGTPRRWRIVPDDNLTALRVNGQPVPLSSVPSASLTDWRSGFTIDLSPWLRRGTNQLEFTLDNSGGPGGIRLHPQPGLGTLLLWAGLLPWLLALGRLFRLPRLQTAILAGALGVLCWYWAATPWSERAYDVKRYGDTGHLGYIIYVAEHWALPPSDQGWEYYQPPLYYGGGALAWRWAKWLGLSGPETLQAYSLMLWLVFLSASAATMNMALRRSAWVRGLATAALALWPSGIIHASRIGNDVGVYALAGVATWCMVRWWRSGRRVHLAGLALSVAAALLCKSSASALLAAAMTLIALRLLRKARWREPGAWRDASAALAVMVAGAVLSVGRNLWYWWHGKIAGWLVGSIATLDADLRVPNELRDYVPLDIAIFLGNPWVSSRDDATGRGNFWNYLLRSSLTGEFSFEGRLHSTIAVIWGVILLVGLLLLLLRFHGKRPTAGALWRDAPWLVLSVSWLASVLSSRIVYPYSCQGDFRFVVPVLVPFIVAWVPSGWFPQALLSFMTLSSVVFFVSL